MNNEGFEEWDASFLEQVIQVEELALSSTNPTQYHHPPPPPFHPVPPYSASSFGNVSYSPPRELSQRVQNEPIKCLDHFSNGITHSLSAIAPVQNTRAAPNAKDQEIDSLKRELGRVSKQLTHLEQECLDLRKERDKKEEKFRCLYSRLDAKDAEVHCTKSANFDVGGEYGVHNQDYPAAPLGCKDSNTSNPLVGCQINVARKAIGVQTDIAVESTDVIIKNDLSTSHQCSRKLLGIWDSTFDQQTGKNLVSKLFVTCETDFHVLFGYLNSNSSLKTIVDSLANEYSSDVSLQRSAQPARSAEAAKVSHLYYMLTKISNGMVKPEALLEAVVDLCCLENVVIVSRSLHILRMVLSHSPSMERKSERSVLYSGIMSWLRGLPLGTTVVKYMGLYVLKHKVCFAGMLVRHQLQ